MSRLHRPFRALAAGLLFTAGAGLLAIDPPHNISTANAYGYLNYCSTCHKIMGGASGAALTTVNGNANLCMSCHVSGGLATNKAFTTSDQAVPASASLLGATAGGTSHRWDSSAAGRLIKGTPNSSTAIITPSGDYAGPYAATIQIQVTTAGATGIAKVAWSQTVNGTATLGAATTITTSPTAQALGTTGVSLAFSSTGTFVLNDIFYLYVRPDLVNPTSAMANHREFGKVVCSTCHDQHLQANAPFDPAAPQTYTAGAVNNRHFQRLPNASDQMCVDCHAPRNVTAKGGISHPITLPLPPTSDFKTPTTAKLSITSNVECQSCHDLHKATVANGLLLRAETTGATAGASPLCNDCHTYATVTTNKGVHFDPTKGVLWPGSQWVTPSSGTPTTSLSTYPAFNYSTDAAKRATCVNCHDPHGWPDARTTSSKYARLLVDDPSNLCLACHDAGSQISTTGTAQAGVPNIQAEITKTIRHPVERTSGRTVMCADCHNPHKAVAGSHTYATTATATRNQIMNGATVQSGPLMGVDGITFNYSGLARWVSPTASTFTATTTAANEYQICMKCHTAYSFGATPPNGITSGGTSSLTLVNGSTQPWGSATGTAKFTSGSTTVSGTGTNWTTANMVGQYIRPVGGTVNTYRVTAVASTTSLTISSSYGQTTTASVAYETRDAAAITASTTVTGYGTAWTSALINQFFAMTSGNTTSYRITAVPSATQLTITSASTSTTPQDFYIHPGASFTNGSTAVIGYGTTWDSTLVGSSIQASGQAGTYVIASVTDATHLTLTANYTNTTGIYRYLLAGPVYLQETDVAREFNPANRSGHPVVVGLNSYTGNTAPKALATGTMQPPWNVNVGTQTMMCSDCHNTDGAAAQGPHGSANQFMLKGANAANWPNVTLQNATTSWCYNCHTLNLSNNGVHTQGNHSGYQCYRCHVVIPHGSSRSRLIGDRTSMPARYAYQNNLNNMDITSFTKGNPATSYSEGNCGVGSGCYSGHNATGGEPW